MASKLGQPNKPSAPEAAAVAVKVPATEPKVQASAPAQAQAKSASAKPTKKVKFISMERVKVPDMDVRELQPLPPLDAKREQALAELRKAAPGAHVEFDPLSGSPSYVQAAGRFLTPAAEGRSPKAVVMDFINRYQVLFGHSGAALSTAEVTREDTTAHNGMTTVVWNQQLDGVPVFKTIAKANVTKRGELVTISDYFMSDPELATGMSRALRSELISQGAIPATTALSLAVASWDEKVDSVVAHGAADGPARKQTLKAAGQSDASASLTWMPLSAKSMVLAWDVVTFSLAKNGMYRVVVDAKSGKVLYRTCLTSDISNATYQVFAKNGDMQPYDSPTPMAPGLATPLSTQPAAVTRQTITTQALDLTASPNGWINDGITETVGNNVDAHTDTNADNVADTPRPNGGAGRNFSFAMDLALAPSTYRDAAVTHLFYLNNYVHDRYYALGFTEAAGNFQTNNFGRGGLGGDAVQADAQDGSGTNNANFSTPPDGTAGRMQMYVFSSPVPDRDGDFDDEIVIHEYTHGLSNRLVGGGVGMNALQSEGMGEGWSDFYALSLLSEAGDDPNGNYAAAGYAAYQLGGLAENYYFGIRRYPYSTNLLKNPLTLKDIDPALASAHAGIPANTIFGSPNGDPAEVHNQGEVWCVTLWEARANIIAKHGHAIGNQLMLQLVTDGMKLAPANPTFLQARDAIVEADVVNNAGANHAELWAAFAKRGMGGSASVPTNDSTSGVVESFDMPDDLSVTPSGVYSTQGPLGGPFSPASRTYTLTNNGAAPLVWSASTAAPWLTLSASGGTLASGATTSVSATINATANALSNGMLNGSVVFTNTTSAAVLPRDVVLKVGQIDYFTEVFAGASLHDVSNQSFLFTPDASSQFYNVLRTPVTGYPTDPAGGTTLVLGDDNFTAYTLTGGAHVSLYGTDYTTIYVGSNGYLTFGVGDGSLDVTAFNHFSLPRIAALLNDLDPRVQGNISVRQLADRVAITYANVPQYGTSNSNSFQFELYFDGKIRITNLAIDAASAVIGLSEGQGVPTSFEMSDFSAYSDNSIVVTLPPSVTEGDGVLVGQGMVTVSQPPASNLAVTLSSSDMAAATVPASVTILAGNTSASFDITVVDDALLDGTQLAVVTATAAGIPAGVRTLPVNDNETATLTLTAPSTYTEGAAPITCTLSVSAPVGRDVAVNVHSTVNGLVVPASVVIPSGSTSVTFPISTPNNAFVNGVQTGTLSATVAGWTGASQAVTLNDDESSAIVVDLGGPTVPESIGFWGGTVTLAGPVSANTTVQLVSSSTPDATVIASVEIPEGNSSTSFDMTIIDDLISEGDETITITASAAGLTNGSASLAIIDDDADHFTFTNVLSPQAVTGPFPVTLSARSAAGAIIRGFAGPVTLAANVGGTPVPVVVVPALPNFSDGECAVNVTFNTLAVGARLTAQSSTAVGASNLFDIATVGVPTSFAFSVIPSPQSKNVPFAVTITAKDGAGNTSIDYTGNAQLGLDSPTGTGIQTGQGLDMTSLPLDGGVYRYTRTQLIYKPSEVGPARAISSLALNLPGAPDAGHRNVIIRVKHTELADYSAAALWESSGWTLVYQGDVDVSSTGWLEFAFAAPFNYDGVHRLMIDFVADAPLPGNAASVAADVLAPTDLRSLFLASPEAGNPMYWAPDLPAGYTFNYLPTIRFSGQSAPGSSTSPTATGSFANGVWTGSVAAGRSGAGLSLSASDASFNVSSVSAPFDVQSAGVLAVTVTGALAENGTAASGTVTLPAAAVADTVVTLTSSDVSEATVPATVTVLAGQISAAFAVTPVDDALLDGPQSIIVTASLSTYDNGQFAVTVADDETATLSVTLPPSAAEDAGVLHNAGTVTLSAPPSSPVVVALAATNFGRINIPKLVTIQAGTTSAPFDVEVIDDVLINASLSATVTASVSGWVSGSATMSLPDNEPRSPTLFLNYTDVDESAGTLPANGELLLPLLVDADLTFTLASSSSSDVSVPATATILAGGSNVSFDMAVTDNAVPQHNRFVTLSATAPGFDPAANDIHIVDDDPHHLTINSVGAAQIKGAPIALNLELQNLDNEAISSFFGTASLSAVAGVSALPITPATTGFFSNGVFSGLVSIGAAATGAAITASVGAVSVTSNTFDLAEAGPMSKFAWSGVASPQLKDTPVPVTVTAQDNYGNTITGFTGTAALSGSIGTGVGSSIVITELNPNTPDEIEFMNVTSAPVNVGGWTIYIYDNDTGGWSYKSFTIPLGTVCAAGQLFRLQESGTSPGTFPQFYYGSNINWVSDFGSANAVLLRDGSGNVVDFVATDGLPASSISSPATIPAEHWVGATVPSPSNLSYGYYRTGTSDHSDASDWLTGPPGMGTLNPGLVVPFPPAETPVPITPTVSGNFVNGVWSGNLTVQASATGMHFRADDGNSHVGKSNTFDVLSNGPISLSLAASATEGDAPVTGTVSVGSAPGSNLTINLTSSVSSEATVPGTVTILAGSTSATFNVTINNDTNLDGPQTTTISATAPGYDSTSTVLTVNDNDVGILSVTLPASAAENAGALTNQGTVTVNQAPTVPVTVSLSSSDTTELTVPATVVVPAGFTSVAFTPTAVDDTVIDGTRSVTVTAHVNGWTNGTRSMNITDNESNQLTVSFGQSSGAESIGTVSGTVSVPAPLESAVTVSLASSSVADASVPATVTIPANGTSAAFTLTVVDDTVYEGSETVTVSASGAGLLGGSAPFQITDNDPHHFAISTIGATQTLNSAFSVTITAQDAGNATMTAFTGTAALAANSGVTPVAMTPAATGNFVNGVWTGSVTVTQTATGVALTATRNSATGTSNTFDVVSAVHHFVVSTQVNRTVATAFSVTVTAQTAANATDTNFGGTVNLSASASGVPVPLTPGVSGAFTNGVWTGNLTLLQAATGVALTANDGNGHTGTSNTFNVVGPATWFSVSAIPSTVTAGAATSVTITAKDAAGNTDTSFTSNANLWATAPGIGQLMIGRGGFTNSAAINPTAQDSRSQTIYTAAQMGGRPVRIEGMSFNVSTPSITPLNSFTIRMRHSTRVNYSTGFLWETTGWTTCYAGTQTLSTGGWVTIPFSTPFDYNGTDSVMLDISFDNSTTGSSLSIRTEPTEATAMITGTSASANGAPTTWSGSAPPASGYLFVPMVRFLLTGGVAPSIPITGTFTSGVWTGNISFAGAAKDVVLNVADITARGGKSNVFALVPAAVVMNSEPAYTAGLSNTVSWPANPTASNYELQAATVNTFVSPVWSSSPASVSELVTGLLNGTLYYYRARAVQNVPHAADSWVQTDVGDFISDTRTNTSTEWSQGNVTLASTAVTTSVLSENFDALVGGAWSSLFPVTSGNPGFSFASSTLTTGPNTTPPVPINQGGDIEGRLAGSFTWAVTANTPSNIFSDGSVDAYMCAETPATAVSGGLMIRATQGDLPTNTPNGYFANISYGSATAASVTLGNTSAAIAFSSSFAVSAADCLHLRLAAKGNKITATAWRVAVVGSVVTETQVASISMLDSRYASGRVGIRSFNGTGALLVDDITISMDRPTYVASGTIVSQPISPTVRSQWGTLNYTRDVTGAGTSFSVDVLDGSDAVLATGVASGTNLNSLGAVSSAATIKLRANLASSNPANTPLLSDWSVGYTALPNQSVPSAWSAIVSSTQDDAAPVLASTPPTLVTAATFTLNGTASDATSGVGSVTVNGVSASTTNSFANWSRTLTLVPGDNTLTIVGADNVVPANTSTLTKVVTYAVAPTVTSLAATSVTTTTATLNATVNPNSVASTAKFQHGGTISYGTDTSITLSPNNGGTAQSVSVGLTGLTPGTLYHFRISGTNAGGTSNGTDLSFTTVALSNNANLSNLTINSGGLSPVFSSGNLLYSATVGNSLALLTLTPTVAQANATVQVRANGGSFVVPSTPLALQVGSNTLEAKVTAQDGVTTRTYQVTVTRNTVVQDWQQANGIVDLNGDDDHDGIPNLAEFAFNLNPGQADGTPCGCGTQINPGDGLTYFTFSFPHRIAASGVVYTVQVSPDMSAGSWTTPPGLITEIGSVPTGDGYTETVTVRIGPAISAGNPSKFARVQVSVVP